MDAGIKRKWVEALRNGKYKQGMRQLKDGDAYCCLGVLCEVAGIRISDNGRFAGEGHDYGPIYGVIHDGAKVSKLWAMNDEGVPFPKIADHIEKHL
jgi:hypothetical protein